MKVHTDPPPVNPGGGPSPVRPEPAPPVGPFRYVGDLMTAARRDPRLYGQEAAKDVLGEIAEHAASTGSCFISDDRLAELTHRHPGTVKRAVRLLQRLGYLPRVIRGAHRGKATVYVLPLVQDQAAKGSAGAPLPGPDDRPAAPQRGAPAPPKGSAGAAKGERNCAPPTSYGTHDGTPHGQCPHGLGSPEQAGAVAVGVPTPRPSAGDGVQAWLKWALDVAASGASLAATRQAASEAAGAIAGRLGSYGPGVIARPLREAISGPEGDRRRLLAAASNADYLLKLGKPPGVAGERFMAIWRGTAHPHYEPMPGSEAAEAARRPEPGAGPRRPAAEGQGGELVELSRELARIEPDPVRPPATGQAEPAPEPSPPRRRPFKPLDDGELRRKLPGAWERLRARLARSEGGQAP